MTRERSSFDPRRGVDPDAAGGGGGGGGGTGAAAAVAGRGLHSSTFQLNLSQFLTQHTPSTPHANP